MTSILLIVRVAGKVVGAKAGGRGERTKGCGLASDSIRANPSAGGDNVLDLSDSYKASLAEGRATALPERWVAGYNDAAAAEKLLLAATSA